MNKKNEAVVKLDDYRFSDNFSDVDFLDSYIKTTDYLLDVLCKNYNVKYDDFVPICSLANELKNRLKVVKIALP